MKKIRISIQETLKYKREAIIEIPDDMSEDKLNNILDKVQRKAYSAEDVTYIIESLNNDIKIIEQADSSLSSPWDTEVEIEDFDYINESVLDIE